MLHFGRQQHPERRPADDLSGRFADAPALLQLLPLAALKTEIKTSARVPPPANDVHGRARRLLREATLLQEVARRTGEIETLAKAASSARRAFELSRGDRRLLARARVKHGEILVLSGMLFADPAALSLAEETLAETAGADVSAAARGGALRAALAARRALDEADGGLEADAETRLAEAAAHLERLAGHGRVDGAEAAESRMDLAELQLTAGMKHKDRTRLEAGLRTIAAAARTLDADVRPLSWGRSELLRGQTLAALGDLSGQPELVSEGAGVLRRLVAELDPDTSPLDAARASHALGRVLQTLAELFEDETLYDGAIAAMGPALSILDGTHELPLRALAAHDAAVCLTRRAERRGDLASLARAEAVFLNALKARAGSRDPLAWAVTQVALARIYAAEAEITGRRGRVAEAGVALAAALDVFAEKGLRSLSEAALVAVERLKQI